MLWAALSCTGDNCTALTAHHPQQHKWIIHQAEQAGNKDCVSVERPFVQQHCL